MALFNILVKYLQNSLSLNLLKWKFAEKCVVPRFICVVGNRYVGNISRIMILCSSSGQNVDGEHLGLVDVRFVRILVCLSVVRIYRLVFTFFKQVSPDIVNVYMSMMPWSSLILILWAWPSMARVCFWMRKNATVKLLYIPETTVVLQR